MIKAQKIQLHLLSDEGVSITLQLPQYAKNSCLFQHANSLLRMWTEQLEEDSFEGVDVIIDYVDGHRYRGIIILRKDIDLANIKDALLMQLMSFESTLFDDNVDSKEKKTVQKLYRKLKYLQASEYQVA